MIKTFVEDHTCPMVCKNFRVTSTYLADKYLSNWKAEANKSVSTFMDRVKQNGLGGISLWQVYGTNEKVHEKIRENMIEHYKVLWDYCKELKRKNIGTTALVKRYAGEFRWLCIYLGSLRDGIVRGYRRVIEVDGFFLKTEHYVQLLTAVGVDANNVIYPVVEDEIGDNC